MYSRQMCCSVLAAEQLFFGLPGRRPQVCWRCPQAGVLSIAEPSTMVTAGASETVATVGLWEQEPNIYNAIPRKVPPPPALWCPAQHHCHVNRVQHTSCSASKRICAQCVVPSSNCPPWHRVLCFQPFVTNPGRKLALSRAAGSDGRGHPRHRRRAAGRRHAGSIRRGEGDRGAAQVWPAHRDGVFVPCRHQRHEGAETRCASAPQ